MWRGSLFSDRFYRLIPAGAVRLCGAGYLVAIAALWLLGSGGALATDLTCPSPLVERQRYGFVATSGDWLQRFAVSRLGAGWYVDTQPRATVRGVLGPAVGLDRAEVAGTRWLYLPLVSSTTPGAGLDRALVVKVRTGYTIDPEAFGSLVDGYPGALWLIGNEPDCIWQDNVTPEEYARVYHDLYHFIKDRDAMSQVAAGSIVQPTPLRLQYLDRALDAYQKQYGAAMPVDVWNIHNAILNEVSCAYDPGNCWGAGIPPGIVADVGVRRGVDDNDNMTIFRNQIRAFRQWMADRGYGGYPLVVSEFGILMPAQYGFTPSRVNAFMSNTFSFFSTAVDPVLGDPTDGHRLVQRWAWFSLDVQPWDPITGEGFNGNLFDPKTGGITVFGQHYAELTSSLPPVQYVDLGPGAWEVPPPPLVISPTQAISYSLRVKVVNRGTVETGSFAVTVAYSGPISGTLAQMVANAPAVSSQWVSFTLENLQVGEYLLTVEIDPDNRVAEADECNNLGTRTLIVSSYDGSLPAAQMVDSTGSQTEATPSGALSQTVPDTSRRVALIGGQAAGSADRLGAGPLTGFVEFVMPTANSYPGQLALDVERQVLWITERDGDKIVQFHLPSPGWGGEYELSAGSQPWGVAVDQAGDVWFAETGRGRIGKLEVSSSTITEYPIPTPNSQPWDVAVGGDGTIWFTERGGGKIGKLAPVTHALTEYSVPSPGGQPGGIAVTQDEVWFTLTAPDQLGWFKIGTEKMETLLRPVGSRPEDIVLTSSGNPWFTEPGANRIVLFAPSTAFLWTLVDAGSPGAEPYGIAMEGDVAVWFTEKKGNRLGRYAGSVPPREYSLPTPDSQPTAIVVDFAGCAWYTAPGTNRIGRFCVPDTDFDTYLPLVVREFRG